ncbi:hypothetical protein NECAME_16032 [Necator americanus]|uniref:Uncharacterized protein n=1 Tax=Necator americanus TaxID=51031 RepID=W2TZ57_NECAM|nr:hypothetical protein NECAME_16032 [Necator americanus]ETN86959.1 hypothetical protein NECAME_16032 [Necator americanus]
MEQGRGHTFTLLVRSVLDTSLCMYYQLWYIWQGGGVTTVQIHRLTDVVHLGFAAAASKALMLPGYCVH